MEGPPLTEIFHDAVLDIRSQIRRNPIRERVLFRDLLAYATPEDKHFITVLVGTFTRYPAHIAYNRLWQWGMKVLKEQGPNAKAAWDRRASALVPPTDPHLYQAPDTDDSDDLVKVSALTPAELERLEAILGELDPDGSVYVADLRAANYDDVFTTPTPRAIWWRPSRMNAVPKPSTRARVNTLDEEAARLAAAQRGHAAHIHENRSVYDPTTFGSNPDDWQLRVPVNVEQATQLPHHPDFWLARRIAQPVRPGIQKFARFGTIPSYRTSTGRRWVAADAQLAVMEELAMRGGSLNQLLTWPDKEVFAGLRGSYGAQVTRAHLRKQWAVASQRARAIHVQHRNELVENYLRNDAWVDAEAQLAERRAQAKWAGHDFTDRHWRLPFDNVRQLDIIEAARTQRAALHEILATEEGQRLTETRTAVLQHRRGRAQSRNKPDFDRWYVEHVGAALAGGGIKVDPDLAWKDARERTGVVATQDDRPAYLNSPAGPEAELEAGVIVVGFPCVSCCAERPVAYDKPMQVIEGVLRSDDGLCTQCRGFTPGLAALPLNDTQLAIYERPSLAERNNPHVRALQTQVLQAWVDLHAEWWKRAVNPEAAKRILRQVIAGSVRHPRSPVLFNFIKENLPEDAWQPAPKKLPARGATQLLNTCRHCYQHRPVDRHSFICTPCAVDAAARQKAALESVAS